MHKAMLIGLVIASLLFSGCTPATPTATNPAPTEMVIPTQAPLPTATLGIPPTFPPTTQPPADTQAPAAPPAAPTALPPATSEPAAPTNPPAAAGSVTSIDASAAKYLDDRSNPVQLISSLFNAVNRKEYLRAFSYWEPSGSIKGTPFDQYQAGYAKTQSVQIVVGTVTGDAGAGNLYYSVPVGMTVQTSDGGQQKFVACYLLHQANPGVQGTLPFQSLGIQDGTARQLQNSQDVSSQLGSACSGDRFNAGHSLPAQPSFDPADISASRYLDDRSDAVEVVRSLYNAINRSEYLRAYSYWESAAAKQQLGSLDAFMKGFADTQSVKLTTGQAAGNAGAGQVYYNLPVTLVAQTRSGATQTFVGCYTLHLANPQIQATPPFQPLAVSAAKIQQVDNNANTATQMASACQ